MLIFVMFLLVGSFVPLFSIFFLSFGLNSKGSSDWLVIRSSKIVSAEVCVGLGA